jgi:hypothetical protein
VRFAKKPPSVGTVIVTHEHNEMKLDTDVTVDGNTQHTSENSVETVERREAVLALAGGAPTRAKVTYTTHHKDKEGRAAAPDPVEGKTYLLEAHGSGESPPSITDPAGNPVSPAEAKVVGEDFKHFGRVDPFWSGLPDRVLATGEAMDEMAKVVLADNAADGLQQVQVHFQGQHDVPAGPAGVFDVRMVGKIVGDSPTTIEGKVTLLLANGLETESEASFPLDITQQGTKEGKTFSVVAHGKMHLHKETNYEQK